MELACAWHSLSEVFDVERFSRQFVQAFRELIANPSPVKMIATFRKVLPTLVSFTALVGAQTCVTNNVLTSVPANGTEVALKSYSYCGGTLNVSVCKKHSCTSLAT